jgi:cobaltochelatase CobN
LALQWAALRRKPNSEKRLALILTNYPSKNARIGNAVGLDTPASVINILRALRNAGYRVEGIPENGNALIEQLIARGSNDRDFATPEHWREAASRVEEARYADWFAALAPAVQQEMRDNWGEPPGDVLCANGAIAVAGLQFGNVFVGLQPPRGYGDNPVAIFHSPDLVPTHHYLAYYRWLKEGFRADAVAHVGKHGTLEWLPGKGIGLSNACYPEVILNDLPHFYPYIVNNPGEGTQAKRRSHAVLVDHLIPAMTTADAYGDIARLEQRKRSSDSVLSSH